MPEVDQLAFVLARGPSIKHYKPINGAATYGVNDIFAYHPVDNLITLDNPWLVDINGPGTQTAERLDAMKASNPKKWYYWKRTNAKGIEDHPGFTVVKLQDYDGKNLFDHGYCPKWKTSAFVATALAARHGYKHIVTYGIDWYGHPSQEKEIKELEKGWKMLANEMKAHGITLYVGGTESYLSNFLPLYKPQSI